MIVFGWGYRTVKNYGPVRKMQCRNCSSENSWILQKVTTWFTLLFIPVIPYKRNNILVCPVCRCSLELSKNEFEELKRIIQDAKFFESDEARRHMNNIVTEAGGIIRTETQLNFIRDMQEFEREKEKKNELT
jgi:uncharacterized protein YbaR (Trm112 family)